MRQQLYPRTGECCWVLIDGSQCKTHRPADSKERYTRSYCLAWAFLTQFVKNTRTRLSQEALAGTEVLCKDKKLYKDSAEGTRSIMGSVYVVEQYQPQKRILSQVCPRRWTNKVTRHILRLMPQSERLRSRFPQTCFRHW